MAGAADSVAVVVSAMGGKPKVTDMLLDLVSLAAQGRTEEYSTRLDQIEKKHMDAIEVRMPGVTAGRCAVGRSNEHTSVSGDKGVLVRVCAQVLLPAHYWEGLRADITKDFDGLRDLLRAVVVMKTNDERTREIVSGHGEVRAFLCRDAPYVPALERAPL